MTDGPSTGGTERLTCEECGDKFDPASLTEVAIHMHDGFVPSGDITGEKIE